MPRIIKATARAIQEARGEWYQFHFEHRTKAQALHPEVLNTYIYAAGIIQPPQMTIYGGVPADFPERTAYELASRYRLDVHLINPWYLSQQGWEAFQNLWQQLPEPIDIFSTAPCVQLGELYTVSTIGREAKPPR